MKKLLTAGLFAVIVLFLPSKGSAVPLDIPAFNVIAGTATQKVTLSTGTFPNNSYGWCLSHVVVSVPNGLSGTFTMYYSTSAITNGTTNYTVVTSSSAPYETLWTYKTPYCSPPGQLLTLLSNIANTVISFEGYMFSGWNGK